MQCDVMTANGRCANDARYMWRSHGSHTSRCTSHTPQKYRTESNLLEDPIGPDDPAHYVQGMQRQVWPTPLTPDRLKKALDEDFGRPFSMQRCRLMLRKYALRPSFKSARRRRQAGPRPRLTR